MNSRRFNIASTLIAVSVVFAISYGVHSQAAIAESNLPPFQFHREGAASPEDAATALFRSCAAKSPKHFVQHLLLGVCDGPIDTLQKFAECLHKTEFTHGRDSFTVYDFPMAKGINPKKPIRVIAIEEFDSEDKQVALLQIEGLSTYYGQTFWSVDVAAESYDDLEYRTRIVVAQIKDRWYAVPRCRNSKSFYEIADAMRLPAPETKEAK
jgi:hypothetical protein